MGRLHEGLRGGFGMMRGMTSKHSVWVACVTGLLGAASHAQVPPAPPHHRDGGYQNNHLEFEPKGLPALVRWKLQATRAGLPHPPKQPIPQVKPELAFIHSNAAAGQAMEPAVTWIGHATLLVQIGGINVLTDPIFSQRASPLPFLGPQRAQPPGLVLAELPHIDAVVISHNHYDHLDLPSLQALQGQAGGPPLVVVPRGNQAWLQGEGLSRVVELDWWQSTAVQGVQIMLTPVQHWSGRGLGDRLKTLWGGYALLSPDQRVYFSGDTGYSPDFAEVARRLALNGERAPVFDLALLAIGGYEPRWFMREQHMNPAEAVQAMLDLRAARAIGMHWGTFELTDEALDEPPRALAAARQERGLSEADFGVLAIGQTRRLPPRLAAPQARTNQSQGSVR